MITIDHVPSGESSVEKLTKETPDEEPLSILALGGSVTWGATLEDRMAAYPWKVGQALGTYTHVDIWPCELQEQIFQAWQKILPIMSRLDTLGP